MTTLILQTDVFYIEIMTRNSRVDTVVNHI